MYIGRLVCVTLVYVNAQSELGASTVILTGRLRAMFNFVYKQIGRPFGLLLSWKFRDPLSPILALKSVSTDVNKCVNMYAEQT